jgi:hypothetical protein
MVVKLRKPQGPPLEIASVTSADPNITATVKPVAEGREYDLTVTLAGNPGRVLTSKILVRTNVERQAEIAIPVYAKVLVLPPRGVPAAPNPRMPALPAPPPGR